MMRGQEVQRNPEVTEWIFADNINMQGRAMVLLNLINIFFSPGLLHMQFFFSAFFFCCFLSVCTSCI